MEITTISDCLDLMLHNLKNGKEKGTSTYIQNFDQCWTWKKGEFNLWTGYSNEGKSLFIRFISIIKAIKDGWKFAFCAPEDYPAHRFYDDMVHTITGYTTDKDNPYCVLEKDYLKAIDLIRDSFVFVYIKPPDNTIKNVIDKFTLLCDSMNLDACIIDPLIKFSRPKEISDRDDIYAGYVTQMCTDFCRQANISLHLVMHQLTPKVTEAGFYPKPSMYTVKGGGSWSDSVDNVLSTWRPMYAKDKIDSQVILSSLKIKDQKGVGIPQDIKVRFDRRSNRYVDFENGKSLFDFDSIMYPKISLKI